MRDWPATSWEGVEAADLARRWGAPQVHLFARVGSTNDVARRLGAAGAGAGTVVMAEEQVAGRGRVGRRWLSPPGLGLWVSVVAAPAHEGEMALLPLSVGLAVARALDATLRPPGVGIKWPNDLWVGEHKLGGILCEASWEGERLGVAVAGVGLNLLHRTADFPEEIRSSATSIALEAVGEVSRLEVADRVIPAVLTAVAGSRSLDLPALAAKDILRGHPVVVTDPMTGRVAVEGVAAGILADGSLVVRDATGREREVRSGTVRRHASNLT